MRGKVFSYTRRERQKARCTATLVWSQTEDNTATYLFLLIEKKVYMCLWCYLVYKVLKFRFFFSWDYVVVYSGIYGLCFWILAIVYNPSEPLLWSCISTPTFIKLCIFYLPEEMEKGGKYKRWSFKTRKLSCSCYKRYLAFGEQHSKYAFLDP